MLKLRNSALMLTAICAIGSTALSPAQASTGWHGLVNIGTAVSSPAVGAVDGIVYVAGGFASSSATAALQAYDPTKNTWSTLASMPETLYQSDGTGTIDSRLYVAGGWNGPLPTNTLYVYNPATNSWATKATMSHLSACGVSGVINSMLYVTTPCNGNSGYFNLLDVYNPATNSFVPGDGSPPLADAGFAPGSGVEPSLKMTLTPASENASFAPGVRRVSRS